MKNKLYFEDKLRKVMVVDKRNKARRDRVLKELESIRDSMARSIEVEKQILQELIDYKNGKSI